MDTSKAHRETTADEAIAGIDLHGVRALVTGGTSGIGAETGRALAAAGAHVTLTGRNLEAGRAVVARISDRHPGAEIEVVSLDLSDPASAREFAARWDGSLHLLVNNAGVMALPARTVDAHGHELQFTINHLGHFALTTGLHAALARGATEKAAAVLGGARIVSLSSRAHLRTDIDFEDIDFERRAYDPLIAYGQSKTANVLLAVEAGRRWAGDGITANALHPGLVLETEVFRSMPPQTRDDLRASGTHIKTVAQGAATSVAVATSPDLSGVTGHYFEDCRPSQLIPEGTPDIPGHARGVAWYALDPARAQRLWALSEEWTAA
jgi:NAD(P)-dependent dehydrogenase (short-subunit alcohol dehydrogenase family)